jgi:pimeloyl-ACP methyl ester carboxylesterase
VSGATTIEWQNGMVISRDGTAIAVLSAGRGPGLVIIPGNNRRAHHYGTLAQRLSTRYTTHVIERRGRGSSGPQGPAYSVEAEVDDALAVMQHTNSDLVFGHSYGGLVALHLGLRRRVTALMAYEPGVSIEGSFDARWLPAFTSQLEQGRHVAAMTTFLKGSRLAPIGNAPTVMFRALAFLLLHGADGRDTRTMMPTTPAEIAEIVRLDSDGTRYAAATSPTLLIGGQKSPTYITGVLAHLARTMPNARHVILPGLDHNAPDLNAPNVVAEQIQSFAQARLDGREHRR